MMIKYRCINQNCNQPILFEGDFIGIIIKKCPKCKKMVKFIRRENNKLEKTCY